MPAHSESNSNSHAYWRGIRIEVGHHDDECPAEDSLSESKDLDEFQSIFDAFGLQIEQEAICEWLESDSSDCGIQMYTDADICAMVKENDEEEAAGSEEEEVEENKCPVSNSDAAHYFEQ